MLLLWKVTLWAYLLKWGTVLRCLYLPFYTLLYLSGNRTVGICRYAQYCSLVFRELTTRINFIPHFLGTYNVIFIILVWLLTKLLTGRHAEEEVSWFLKTDFIRYHNTISKMHIQQKTKISLDMAFLIWTNFCIIYIFYRGRRMQTRM